MKKDFFKGDNDNKFCTVGEAIVRLKEAGYSKDIFLGAENGSGFYYIGSADCGSIDDRSDEMIDEKETKLEEINAKLVAHIAAFNGSLSEDGYELEKQLKKMATYANTLSFLAKLAASLQRYKNLWVPILFRRIVKAPYARIAKDGLVMITTGIETNGEWWKGERNEAKKPGLETLEEMKKEVEDDNE